MIVVCDFWSHAPIVHATTAIRQPPCRHAVTTTHETSDDFAVTLANRLHGCGERREFPREPTQPGDREIVDDNPAHRRYRLVFKPVQNRRPATERCLVRGTQTGTAVHRLQAGLASRRAIRRSATRRVPLQSRGGPPQSSTQRLAFLTSVSSFTESLASQSIVSVNSSRSRDLRRFLRDRRRLRRPSDQANPGDCDSQRGPNCLPIPSAEARL